MSGTLAEVVVANTVQWYCVAHAFTTEREEIMGLCLGDVVTTNDGRKVGIVWDVCHVPRSDKQSDRVEVNPEVLIAAQERAERVSTAVGHHTRVVGWYHSHPHITCLPSHVDLATQRDYQQLDTGWVGLIFAVFSADQHKAGRVQVHCFQTRIGGGGQPQLPPDDLYDSVAYGDPVAGVPVGGNGPGDLHHIKVPVRVVSWTAALREAGARHPPAEPPATLRQLQGMLEVFRQEERQAFSDAEQCGGSAAGSVYRYGVYQKALCRVLGGVCRPLRSVITGGGQSGAGESADWLRRQREDAQRELQTVSRILEDSRRTEQRLCTEAEQLRQRAAALHAAEAQQQPAGDRAHSPPARDAHPAAAGAAPAAANPVAGPFGDPAPRQEPSAAAAAPAFRDAERQAGAAAASCAVDV